MFFGPSPARVGSEFAAFFDVERQLRRRKAQQVLPNHEQIRKCEQDVEAIFVLSKAAVTDFPEAEESFDRTEDVVHARARGRLPTIRLFIAIGQRVIAICTLVDECTRSWRFLADCLGLADVR